jgi:capsular exopolysaccharide synthesis family protein
VSSSINSFEQAPDDNRVQRAGILVNPKRVFSLALQYWYVVALCIAMSVVIAFLINRYTTRIYSVSASIIVREGTENAAAEFLYKNNPLVNPYRNFYNELYIMRSYPLLQEVIESLNFSVAWYREGNVKTTEEYDSDFPVKARIVKTTSMPYGRRVSFIAKSALVFSLEYINEDGSSGKLFDNLTYNDTVSINGYKFYFELRKPITEGIIGKKFILEFIDPYMLARQYAGKLNATWAELGASVVNLNISGPIPEKDIDFLNRFIDRYQQYDVDKKNLVATKSIDFLDKQLTNIGDSLNYFDNKIENFKETHFSTDFNADAQRIYSAIDKLESRKSELVLFDSYYEYVENYLKTADDIDQIVPPSAVGITDDVLTGLIDHLTAAQFNLRLLGGQQTSENPLVVDSKQKIKQLKGDLLEGMSSIKATQKISFDLINKQIDKAEQQLVRLPRSERVMIDLKRNYTIRENMYLFLMQKRAEAGISRASTTSDIIVVNPPSRRGGAMTPKPMLNYAIAIAGGLFLPFLFFFIAELLNDRVQSREDVEQLTSIPLLGGIGHNASEDTNLVVLNKPKSAMAESFRALRSNLNYFTESKDKKIILVTSSISGEGKTFTTINLASVLAFSGKKVIIIGADMRKPRLFTDFDLHNDIGLSSFLSSLNVLSEVIQHTGIENLDLISGGPVPPNPAELLMLPKVEAMMRELLETYDYILLDTPPLGIVADAFSLMPFVHHTIFIIRQDYTPRFFLRDLQELLERRDLANVSILFNDIKKTGPGYGNGHGYQYGYDSNYASSYYGE